MTETAVTKQPEDTTHTQRAGQRGKGNGSPAEYRSDGVGEIKRGLAAPDRIPVSG
jgi:hypothetical protein